MARRMLLPAGLAAVAALALGPVPAAAQKAADEARWVALQELYFPGRSVAPAEGVIAVDGPTRAADAALVPISVTVPAEASGDIAAIHLIVDSNPVPLAGIFRFAPGTLGEGFTTRIRVDQYTLIHAVAEMADGRLLAADDYVKASGGCSAPPMGDPAAALARLGEMRLNLPERIVAGEPVEAQLLISHPNLTGMQFDQIAQNYIPPHYIETIKITLDGEPVLDLKTDISLSADPSIHFTFVPDGPGVVAAEVVDSKQSVFTDQWDVAPTSGS